MRPPFMRRAHAVFLVTLAALPLTLLLTALRIV
jgi:hypothetical protein